MKRLPIRLFFAAFILSTHLAVVSACGGSPPEPIPAVTATTVKAAVLSSTAIPTTVLPTSASVSPTPAATSTQIPSAGPFAAFIGSRRLSEMQQTLEQNGVDYIRAISVDLGRRLSGSDEEAKAADYLKKEFESFGYQASIQEFQAQLRTRGDSTPTPLYSRNVVAIKPGANASSPILVLGGHFDTVATGPGANDNASGTAVLLTVAKELAQVNLGYEIRFVAFGSEEIGLIGSREFLNRLTIEDKVRIQAMLNFDALGGGSTSILIGSPDLVRTASTIARLAGIRIRESEEPPNSTSDHFNFLREGIPVLYFGGDDYSLIHTPQDTIENITPRLIGEAALIGYLMTRQIASPQPLGNPEI